MRIGHWHPETTPAGSPGEAFAAHVHGRDLEVVTDRLGHAWHWQVRSPHGSLLADGCAPTLEAAEEAAEDEAMAVHPPTAGLLERLLT